ncbi:MAG TPA: enoyl-CoA hydratase/isomerase family protein [Acidimicrobiia bacterium]|nr:enoyl-CoA hydratase/isomerase family protein [Acidimicrobiia bacterium]
MDSSHETIDVRQDGRRVFVTLDRPEVLNAQNEAFLRDFLDVTAGLAGRDDFDAVAVRSSCDHWGAGLDLKAAAEGWRLTAKTVEWWETALRHLETIKQLVVALIDGYCLGGGLQLALACDLRIATDRATVAIPASREVGFLAGMAPWRLPRLVGIARAKALLLGGAVLTGAQAAQWGVVDQVVPGDGLEPAWEEIVAPLNADNLDSSGECKRMITSALETDHDRARADFLATQTRLLASEHAEARLGEAVDLFRSGGRPSLDTGWFPLGRNS